MKSDDTPAGIMKIRHSAFCRFIKPEPTFALWRNENVALCGKVGTLNWLGVDAAGTRPTLRS